ncbi:right-handed parallel beta-helix repeat-containing protein [Streptomyces sp. NBC_01538]|uniref:right-handed parallel beta-helix repeat-containing protein n=1 Tax=Streptomyces sp. NBC_01538 TaxID=2903897 RepID=UPI003867AFE4
MKGTIHLRSCQTPSFPEFAESDEPCPGEPSSGACSPPRNRVGLTLNSNDLEALGPQHGAVVAGNTLTDNNDEASPEQADGGFGIGVGAGGGRANVLERNLISGNKSAGVLLSDVQGYPARANSVRANRVTDNGTDLVLATGTPAGNCFTGNGESATSPTALPRETRCGSRTGGAARAEPDTGLVRDPLGHPTLVQAPPGISFQDVPPPPNQHPMPAAETTRARPAIGLPGKVNPRKFLLPDAQ